MNIKPIAYFRGPFSSKFGIPRQSGLVKELQGRIVLTVEWRTAEALRGLEEYDYLWILWGFSENVDVKKTATVRPPLLGGNKRIGVFATRSPFRPNNIGLSSVRLERIDWNDTVGPIIYVIGADLMDGTPIYDIKPYLPYVDSHPEARSGFQGQHAWQTLEVVIPENVKKLFDEQQLDALIHTLQLDPRPPYHDDPTKVYGMSFAGHNINFRVEASVLTVID